MTTRLSGATKELALSDLRTLLNNVVAFVGCPITDRDLLVSMWNSKFPAELVESVMVLGKYNAGFSSGTLVADSVRWCTEIDGRLHSAFVSLNEVGPLSHEKIRAGIMQYAFALNIYGMSYKKLKLGDGTYSALEITPQDMSKFLGADLTDEVISWMKQTAVMREDLILASDTLESIFDMAATAGQIKRMVPELLQYLPAEQRKAFEEQKRSSTLPFEWAPYPKCNVDVMLAQINKGHLLHGMRKPNRMDLTVESIDQQGCTWTRRDCFYQQEK